jgi:hypothetical protein
MPLRLQRLELTRQVLHRWEYIMASLDASVPDEINLLQREIAAVEGCREADPNQADLLLGEISTLLRQRRTQIQ